MNVKNRNNEPHPGTLFSSTEFCDFPLYSTYVPKNDPIYKLTNINGSSEDDELFLIISSTGDHRLVKENRIVYVVSSLEGIHWTCVEISSHNTIVK